jgi:hypothetical protein
MLHQFEEHGIDVFGAHYHFIHDLCLTLGHPSLAECPASPAFVLAVNVGGGVWIPGLLALLWHRRNVLVGACAMGIPLVNIVAHVGPALVRGTYNSGLVTALVLFVPLCTWTLIRLKASGLLARRTLAGILATGGFTHALLILSLEAHARGLLSQSLLIAVNIAYGAIPLVIGTFLHADAAPAPGWRSRWSPSRTP